MSESHTQHGADGPGMSPDWFPLESDEHERQLAGLRRRLAPAPKRILDLGSGDGRIARPLAAEGHAVIALDHDGAALARCAAPNITTILTDATARSAFETIERPLDAVLCLGHTFLIFADPLQALGLLRRVRGLFAGSGALMLDNFPGSLWREVAEGNWQEGMAEDGATQLLWADGDNVIALREGADVDDRAWHVGPRDTPLRLWSMGELRLLARVSGFCPPETAEEDHLLILRPHDPADSE